MRIDMPLYDQRTHTWDVVAKAEIVNVAPHLASAATFAVYVNPFGSLGDWRVANVETSAVVATDCDTRGEALKLARLRLATKTLTDVTRAMREKQRHVRQDKIEDATKDAGRKG